MLDQLNGPNSDRDLGRFGKIPNSGLNGPELREVAGHLDIECGRNRLHQFDIDFAGRIHQTDLNQRHVGSSWGSTTRVTGSIGDAPKPFRLEAGVAVLIRFARDHPKPLILFIPATVLKLLLQ